MDDMGRALAPDPSGSDPSGSPQPMIMLGGGNPAEIPAVNAVWRRRLEEVLREPRGVERLLATYDTPQGQPQFLSSLATLLQKRYQWDVTRENIAVTNGSQSAFFLLLNMLSGAYPGEQPGRVLFPLLPEYLGYADQSLDPAAFVACTPVVEQLDEHTHKYRIDFTAVARELERGDIRAICVSRPTNPSGNVLTDDEMARLDTMARDSQVPLLVDNAYGMPFPHIIFDDLVEGSARPLWNENIVLGMSLSKIGLPGARTGIIIARREIITALSRANAVLSLANTMVGQVLVEPLVASGELLGISREVIAPFYRQRAEDAREALAEVMPQDIRWSAHRTEGSIFLWLRLPGLPVPSKQLYQRLKERGVLVVPGEYFFFGGDHHNEWRHSRECIRINYGQDPALVRRGLEIIAREVEEIWNDGGGNPAGA